MRSPRTLIAALTLAAAAAMPVATAQATTAPGLLQVTVTIEGKGIAVCQGTLSVKNGNETTTPKTSGACTPGNAAANFTHTFALSEAIASSNAPTTAQVSYSLPQAVKPAPEVFYGGDCDATGTVSIHSAHESDCTVDVYPIADSQTLGTPPGTPLNQQLIQHTVVVTEALAGAQPTTIRADLCKLAFRFDEYTAAAGLTEPASTIAACAPGHQPQGNATSAQTIVQVAAPQFGKLAISDASTLPGWVTTYSEGCTALAKAGALIDVTGAAQSCTITHTFADQTHGTSTGTSEGLVSIAATQVGGATPKLCDLSIVATVAGKPYGQPVSLCRDAAHGAKSALSAAQLTLALPAGDVKLAAEPAAGSSTTDQLPALFGGDCSADQPKLTVKVEVGNEKSCTLTVYPIDATITLPGGGLTDHRLASITEVLTDPTPTNIEALCRAKLEFGVVDISGLANAAGEAAVCKQPAGGQRAAQGTLTLVRNFLLEGPADQVTVADNLTGQGDLTTYGAGCTPRAGGSAALQHGSVLTCTITHTQSKDDKAAGTLTVVASAGAPGFSVCATKLVVDKAATGMAPASAGTALASVTGTCTQAVAAHGTTPAQPQDATFTVGLPAGKVQLSLEPKDQSTKSSTNFALEGGGDCDDLTVTIAKNLNRNCTLTAYETDGTVDLGGHAQRVLAVTEVLTGLGAGGPSAAATDLCRGSFQIGTLDHFGSFTPKHQFSACVKGRTPTNSAGTLSSTTTLAVSPPTNGFVGLLDDFPSAGTVATYSDGCQLTAAQQANVVKIAAQDAIDTCTVTHTLPSPTQTTQPTQPVQPVQPITSTTAVSCSQSAAAGNSYTCAATVTLPSGDGTATGTVSFAPGGASCTLQSGTCSATIAAGLSAGTVNVTATYAGEGTTVTGSTGSATVSVTLRPTAIQMACTGPNGNPPVITQTITCTLTVQDAAQPSTFSTSGTTVYATAASDTEHCTLSASDSCTVTFATGFQQPGQQTITSSYPAGTEFAASSGSYQIAVGGVG